jgi:hypothetical protein
MLRLVRLSDVVAFIGLSFLIKNYVTFSGNVRIISITNHLKQCTMILLTTILDKIEKEIKPEHNLRFDFDCRFMDKWIREYPQCFPKFVKENRYNIIFNRNLLRYELNKI